MATSKKPAPRWCYYIPPCQDNPRGFIPSLVTEHEAGHSPMTGRGEHAEPWYWGDTLERAQEVCARYNLDRLGISKRTASRIVASSMAAGVSQ